MGGLVLLVLLLLLWLLLLGMSWQQPMLTRACNAGQLRLVAVAAVCAWA